MNTRKIFLTILLTALFAVPQVFAQLTGTKTIPGDYATIALAIADLNTQGVGSGGVTFNVAAGHTETLTSEAAGTITATGTLSDPVIFQKSGAGANPLVTAYAWTAATATDGMIKIAGGDYITFDGIDLQENAANTTNRTDWGYALVKASATTPFNGCQYVTIKNCTITLNKLNTTAIGIYTGNHIATSTTSLTILATSDANNNNKFYGNTITNVYGAFSLNGYSASSPYSLYDQNNEIGVTAANTITNLGAGSTSVRAIYAIYQNGLKVVNNSISSEVAGATTTVYGIFLSTGTSSNVDINNNTVTLTLTSGTYTSTVNGINNAMGGTAASNTVNINNNIVQNCNLANATSGAFNGILNSASAATVNINGNTVTNNILAGTGTFTGIDGGTGTNLNISNNLVYGNQKSGASGTMYCTRGSTAIVTYNGNQVYNNTIPTTSGTSSASLYGYYNFGSPTVENLYNNNIYDLSIGGTTSSTASAIYGLYTNTTATAVKNIYTNTIKNLILNSTGGGTIYGFYQALGAPAKLYSNNLYNFSASATGGIVYGIYVSSGTTNYLYNNFVSDLRAPASTSTTAVNGIYISGGTTVGAYYNTVYLNASSSGTTFGTAGIYASTSPTVELRNNVIVNMSVPGNGSYLAKTVAYRRSSSTLTSYASTSNNNDFYAGVPDSARVIYFDGGANLGIQTMTAYKTFVSPRDAASFSENPPFINVSTTPYDLHMNTGIATQTESGGAAVSTPIAITDDFDGNTRTATPDVGADEFIGTGLDLTPPTIAYSPLVYTSSTANRTLIVTVTDASNVPTTAPGWPYLYWKINSGAYTGVAPVSVAGSQYTFSFGAGVVPGDTVRYYVVAQDIPGNVGAYPSTGAGGFTINPPAAATPPTNPSGYLVTSVPLSGDYTVGTLLFNRVAGRNITFEKNVTKIMKSIWVENPRQKGDDSPVIFGANDPSKGSFQMKEVEEITWTPMENGVPYTGDLYVKKSEHPELVFDAGIEGVYATITAAVNDLNLRGVGGPVNFLLNDATYNVGESFPLLVNIVNEALPTATNTVTFKPNTGVVSTITGSATSGIFVSYGVNYVTIDGSNSGGTDRSLTIQNTAVTASSYVVGIFNNGANGSKNNTIKNCVIKGGINTLATTWGIILNYSGGDYDNTTVQNNEILKAYVGMQYCGVATGITNGGLISGNIFGSDTDSLSLGNQGLLTTYVDGLGMTQNTFKNIKVSTTPVGLILSTSTINTTVTRNLFNGIIYTGTGGYGGRGIYASTGSAASNLNISNNLISNIGGDGYSGFGASSPVGMYFDGTTGGLNIHHNSVYMSGNLAYNTTTLTTAILFNTTTITNVDLRDNIFQNSMNNPNNTGAKNYAIYSTAPAGSFTNINYNDYYVSGTQGKLGYLGADILDLTAWKTATTQDLNSISADPKFQSTANLHIDPNFNVVSNNGVYLLAVDFDGETRNNPPDVGADEYTYVPPAVLDPTAVTATPISGTQINVAFTPNAANNNVVVVWNSTGTFTPPTGAPVVGDPLAGGTVLSIGITSPVNHTGLTPISTYYYKLFSYDGVSYSSGVTANATTPCATISTFPWTEGFEGMVTVGSKILPSCWSYENVVGTNGPVSSATSGTYYGPNTGTHFIYTYYATTTWVFTPGMTLTAGVSYDFSFYMMNKVVTSPVDFLMDVAYGTAQNGAGMTNVLATGIVCDNSSYVQFKYTFTPSASGDYYFGVKTTSGSSTPWYISLDDFRFETTPACPIPSNVAVSGVTSTTANVSWSAAPTVDIDYGTVGHPAGTGTVITGTSTNPYTITGLTASTSYDVFVRQNCGGSTSSWVGPINFTTACASVLAPFTQDFELGVFPPSCWSITGTSLLWISGAHSGYGTGSYSALADFYNVSTGSADLVTVGFDASGMPAAALKFDWAYAAYSSTYIDSLVIFSSTNGGSTWTELAVMPGGLGSLNPYGLIVSTEYIPAAGDWSTITYNLPAGTNVVKFRAITDYGNQLYVDNIRIVEPIANDVGTVSIDMNPGVPVGSVAPQATVKNFGIATNSFNVQMTITGGYSSTKAVTSLAPGATQQVTFDNWNATEGSYTVNVCTQLGTDADPSNDCKTQSVGVYTGSWSTGAVAPYTAYLGGGATYVETVSDATVGYLFSIGGSTPSALNTECAKYNISTDTWSTIASLPAGRNRHAVVSNGAFVYAIGGYDVTSALQVTTVYKYDIAANTWNTVAPLPLAIGWGKAVSHGNYIYHAGGYSGAYQSAVYVYNTVTNTWATATSMPEARFGGAMSISGNKIVYVGGATSTGLSSGVMVGTIDAVDPTVIVWTTADNTFPGKQQQITTRFDGSLADPERPLEYGKIDPHSDAIPYPVGGMYRFDAAPWGTDGIIVATGCNTDYPPVNPNPCYVYNVGTDTWTIKPFLPLPVIGSALGTFNSTGNTWKLIVAQGNTDGTGTGGTNATQIMTDNAGAITTFPLTVNVSNGWNMVSIPGLLPTNQNVTTWWPGKDPAASVFKFLSGYQTVTIAAPGQGYWMKNLAVQTYNTGDEWPAGGINIVTHDPIPGLLGWNMIGGYEQTVPTAGLTTTPPGLITGTIYKYTPGSGYQAAADLVPGYGYWVKLTGAGSINVPSVASGPAKIVAGPSTEGFGKITITDAVQKSYTLYAVNGQANLAQFDLPPYPPQGMFDVRYSSQRYADNISTPQSIEMMGVQYPVKIKAEETSIIISDETGKEIARLKAGEEVSVTTAGKLFVSENVIPAVYSLEQNYPNPFNPSTTIQFSIPEDVQNVKLIVYSALGEKVAELVNTGLTAGIYKYNWNASNVASGLYIYQIVTEKFVSTKKMMLLK